MQMQKERILGRKYCIYVYVRRHNIFFELIYAPEISDVCFFEHIDKKHSPLSIVLPTELLRFYFFFLFLPFARLAAHDSLPVLDN